MFQFIKNFGSDQQFFVILVENTRESLKKSLLSTNWNGFAISKIINSTSYYTLSSRKSVYVHKKKIHI